MILDFDFSSNIPLYMQLRNQIVIGIAEGKLNPGDKLPTIRALADESGINMMTVSKAYQLLKQEGFIYTDRRNGAMVAEKKDLQMDMGQVSKDTLEALKLHLSELRLAGISCRDALDLCKKLYEEGEL